MAITILQACSQLQPAYNELIHLVTSSNKTQTNFKYICDVYVNSVLIDRLGVPPHPTYGTGLFNPARIIENYVNNDIDNTILGVSKNANSYTTYQLKFGESYGSVSSGSTVYPNMALTGLKYVWNGIVDYEDFTGYTSGDYLANSSTKQFLTNAPSSGDIQFTENAFLYFIQDTTLANTCFYYRILNYNSAGVNYASKEILNQYKNPNGDTTHRFLKIPSGPNNLNTITDTFQFGSQPVIASTDSAYSIQFFTSGDIAMTQAYRYAINSPCTKYTTYRIHFLNKKGGYDSFTFFKKNTFTSDIKRENFKSNLGVQTATTHSYTKQQRAITQYSTKLKDLITCESDWITETQSAWLEELISSPDVYVEKSGSLVPINITNSSYERKLQVNKHLFNLKIEFNYSYERQRQRF